MSWKQSIVFRQSHDILLKCLSGVGGGVRVGRGLECGRRRVGAGLEEEFSVVEGGLE